MSEVCSVQELSALSGCTMNAVYRLGEEKYEYEQQLCLDLMNKEGKLVAYFRLVNGAWHFHKSITVDQVGELVKLIGCADIHSIHFNSFNSVNDLPVILIKPIGISAVDRVLTILRGIFPMLKVSESVSEWDFDGRLHTTHQCTDPSYNVTIVVFNIDNEGM